MGYTYRGKPPYKMTEADYHSHVNAYDGICTECGEIRYGDTEPDAEGYHCDECGADAVQGIENALMTETITIV